MFSWQNVLCFSLCVLDNWALVQAQRLALEENLPLHICVCLVVPKSELSTLRHYSFMLKGLKEVAKVLTLWFFECTAMRTAIHSNNALISLSIFRKKIIRYIACILLDQQPDQAIQHVQALQTCITLFFNYKINSWFESGNFQKTDLVTWVWHFWHSIC